MEKSYKNKTQICIIGDSNEVIGEDPSLMSSICVKFQLHDVFVNIYP